MLGMILISLGLFLLLVAVFAGGRSFGQGRFIYFPEKFRTEPASVGLDQVSELGLKAPDGTTLIAWYGKASPGKPTLLFFHGNAGALRSRTDRIMLMQQRGYGFFMLSYRGYGGSDGKPSEHKIISDAFLAYQWLLEQGVRDYDIVLYGQSLGSGVAVQVAAQRRVGCLILEAPFTSLTDIAKGSFPYLPVNLLLRDRYDSFKWIEHVSSPILVLHGAKDEIVPLELGQQLYDLARSPKTIEVFPLGTHSDLYLQGAWEKVTSFVDHSYANY